MENRTSTALIDSSPRECTRHRARIRRGPAVCSCFFRMMPKNFSLQTRLYLAAVSVDLPAVKARCAMSPHLRVQSNAVSPCRSFFTRPFPSPPLVSFLEPVCGRFSGVALFDVGRQARASEIIRQSSLRLDVPAGDPERRPIASVIIQLQPLVG